MGITAERAALFGRAVSLKLAADGLWEWALTQPVQDSDPHRRGRDQWLEAAGDDVAIEIAFETQAFVGLRLRSEERASANQLVLAVPEPGRFLPTSRSRMGAPGLRAAGAADARGHLRSDR